MFQESWSSVPGFAVKCSRNLGQVRKILQLRSYVNAMGGKLSLIVEFPDQTPVSLEGFGDTEEPPRMGAVLIGTPK